MSKTNDMMTPEVVIALKEFREAKTRPEEVRTLTRLKFFLALQMDKLRANMKPNSLT